MNKEIKDKIKTIEEKEGRELVVMKFYKEGVSFCEYEFIKNIKRPFYAFCLTKCELIVLKKSVLENHINFDKIKYMKH